MSETSDLSVGDTVQLNSGGPAMTIDTIDDDGLFCIWFGGSEQRHAAQFPTETIRRVEEASI